MAPIYNSQDEAYKKPFGAIKAGETVRFTLRVPSSYGCETPHLCMRPDGWQDPNLLPMNKTGREEDADIFTVETSLDSDGLYFYWFDLWKDYRKLYRGMFGRAVESTEEGRLFQLTVYNADFKTPENLHGGVMYQIFPDRFFEGDPDKPLVFNERIYRADKQNEPYFWTEEGAGEKATQDYFGGDLLGIEKRLPFLQSLGVTWLYLNPIFEAHANHRYNTADYLRVDPYLGTNVDFARLCEKAKEYGIRIILDGVFSHTGSDSLYFNKESRYPTFGAWQGPGSPYRNWYHFHPDGGYDSWWGFDTLPACNKNNPEFRQFICGEGGVVDTWLALGASGFRLDVADELPDDLIADIRKAVKRRGEENFLIGEVWEDASTKVAYDIRRRYFMGSELDGVMNYPFRNAILQFLKTFDAASFREEVMSICENYPGPALAACTTHLSTHDTVRAITELVGEQMDGHNREWQSGRRLTPEQYHLGILRMRLAFVLQFTLPGVPCVYYGDEIAMQGYRDPFNRAYYDWNSGETRLIPLMMRLSGMRKNCCAFKEGQLVFKTSENGMLVYERVGEDGSKAAVAINCSGWPATVELLGETVKIPMMSHAIRIRDGHKK